MVAPIDNKLEHLYPSFREKIENIVTELTRWCTVHYPGHKALVFETFRTLKRQQELYSQGRKNGVIVDKKKVVTNCDGIKNLSRHQYTLAADIVTTDAHGAASWDAPIEFWDYLQHLAHVQGLTSGKDWAMCDEPHVEWPSTDHATYAATVAWKKSQGLV